MLFTSIIKQNRLNCQFCTMTWLRNLARAATTMDSWALSMAWTQLTRPRFFIYKKPLQGFPVILLLIVIFADICQIWWVSFIHHYIKTEYELPSHLYKSNQLNHGKPVWILISWFLKKTTDLDLHRLHKRIFTWLSMTMRLNAFLSFYQLDL